MATYQEIKGRTVQNLASDPPAALGAGQVWYNTASDVLKASVGVGGWSAGGVMNTSRADLGAANAAANSAGLGFGGSSTAEQYTEEYNGTTWAEVDNMVTAVTAMVGGGIQTAAFAAGGYAPGISNQCQNYDGTSWTTVNSLTTARSDVGGGGPQTAGMAIGGNAPPYSNAAESYDATSWTAETNLPVALTAMGGCGTVSAFLASGGGGPALTGATNIYDATAWTTVNPMNTPRRWARNFGIQTSCITSGNYPATTQVEEYDGTSWATTSSLTTQRYAAGTSGTTTAGMVFAGQVDPGHTANTEEWTLIDTVQTITST